MPVVCTPDCGRLGRPLGDNNITRPGFAAVRGACRPGSVGRGRGAAELLQVVADGVCPVKGPVSLSVVTQGVCYQTVAAWERECCVDRRAVSFHASDKGTQVRHVDVADSGRPARESLGVARVKGEEWGEVPDGCRELGRPGAGCGESGQEFVVFGLEVVGPGQQHPGEPAWGDVASVGVCSALVDVLVQEVAAAGEAEGLDLLEEVLDGTAGFSTRHTHRCSRSGSRRLARYLGTRSMRSSRSTRA